MLIYLIENQVTGKCYVGQTRRTLKQRFLAHKKVVGKSNACKALSDAMVKYGVENFIIKPLRTCESQEEMDFWEIKLISDLNTFAPGGYNLTLGGGGKYGYKHSAESIEKTASHHRGKKRSEEHKRKISESLTGNKNALGLKHSEETKRKIGNHFLGVKRPPFNQEHREKIAAARRGSKASQATRQKMSESRKRFNEAQKLKIDQQAESALIGHWLMRELA